MAGWAAGSSEWKSSQGHLLGDGSEGYHAGTTDLVTAPYVAPTSDYAVEAAVRVLTSDENCYLGIFGRGQNATNGTDPSAYGVGYYHVQGEPRAVADILAEFGGGAIAEQPFTPGGSWHVYRAEFRGTRVGLKIDGAPTIDAHDNRYLHGRKLGLLSGACQVEVAGFQVLATA
jgi:hypothetical protein